MKRCIRAFIFVTSCVEVASAVSAALPVTFEENRGQAAPDVAFLSRAAGYRVFLTRSGAVIAATDGTVVRIRLAGAVPTVPAGVHRLSARSNYLVGSDPAHWRTGVPNYEEVRYTQTYSGIDVVWHGRDGQIEEDFVVSPRANPYRIQLEIEGAAPALSAEGELTAGSFRLHRPRAYQDGHEVTCRYVLHGHSVRFDLAKYDHNRSLTIDPVLSFSTFLGGSLTDSAAAISLDIQGNIYVAGTTTSADFPISSSAVQKTPAEGNCSYDPHAPAPCANIFVTKFTGDGSTLLFSTYLGGSGNNSVIGMALDKTGNVYLTGVPGGPDFPKLTPLPGYSLQQNAPYVAKLNSDGSALLYASQLPLPMPANSVAGLAVDATGAVYLTGATNGGLPVVNAFQNTHAEALIFKTADLAVNWEGLMDGLPVDLVDTITVDPTNPQTLYLGMDHGLYKSTDAGGHWIAVQQGTPPQAPYPDQYLRPTSVAIDRSHPQTVYLGTQNNGIYKSTDGGTNWAASGTGANRFVRMIAIDPTNTTILYAATDAGLYKSTDGAATWKPTGLMAGPNDSYFAHNVVLNPATPTTVYAGTPHGVMKSIDAGATWTAMTNGFSESTDITALVIDPANPQTLYATTTVNFAPYRTSDGGAHWTQGQWPASNAGGSLYVTCLLVDPLVHSMVWAATDEGLLVSRDSGATWVAPATELPEDTIQWLAADSAGALYAITNGFSRDDAFAMKLDPSGSKIVYSTYLGGLGSDYGAGIAVDATGRAYIVGQTDSFDFPVAAALQTRLAGRTDAFIAVLDPAGAHLAWSTYFGGSEDDRPSAMALDSYGDIHLTGWTYSPDFPLRQAAQTRYGGQGDAFAAKVKGDGSAVIFSTFLGGSDADFANAVATDVAGNTYVAGITFSKDLPTVNAIQSALTGAPNALVAALNGQTGKLQYATYLGGTGRDYANAIAADAAGNVYIAGDTTSADFPTKYAFQPTIGTCPAGVRVYCVNQDAFLAKIGVSGGGPQPTLTPNGVRSVANGAVPNPPGSLVYAQGANLAGAMIIASSTPLRTHLQDNVDDVSVTVNGISAPMYYALPNYVSFQLPWGTDLSTGTATMVVTRNDIASAPLQFPVSEFSPGIYTTSGSGSGMAWAIFATPSQINPKGQVAQATSVGAYLGVPATAGDRLYIYAGGLGPAKQMADGRAPCPLANNKPGPCPGYNALDYSTTTTPVVMVGGVQAKVNASILDPTYPGLYLVFFEIPAGTQKGNAVPLQLKIGGLSTDPTNVTIAIQ